MGLFKKKTSLEVGGYIPNFALKNQNGEQVSFPKNITGNGAVIYFYPKNESGVCTKEACTFGENYDKFLQAGIHVFGINAASEKEHRQFQQNHSLPFSLLSDPGNKVLKSFNIPGVLFLTGRETFVIDKAGKIVFKYRGFLNGEAHAEEVIRYLQIK